MIDLEKHAALNEWCHNENGDQISPEKEKSGGLHMNAIMKITPSCRNIKWQISQYLEI
jgi:hypothetical protein